MATTLTPVYGTTTAFTLTVNSLASAAARAGTARDNSSTLNIDDRIGGSFKAVSTPASTAVVNVYIAALVDATNYAAGASGTDAAFTMPTNTGNLLLVAVVPINSTTAEYWTVGSVAQFFGGILPKKYVVVVQNSTGQTLDSTGNAVSYTPLSLQSV